jgi:hypothetical protein
MSDNGTGMDSPAVNTPSGAVTSQEATRKNPKQSGFRSGINSGKPTMRIDRNKHGIRRETNLNNKKTGRPKKV